MLFRPSVWEKPLGVGFLGYLLNRIENGLTLRLGLHFGKARMPAFSCGHCCVAILLTLTFAFCPPMLLLPKSRHGGVVAFLVLGPAGARRRLCSQPCRPWVGHCSSHGFGCMSVSPSRFGLRRMLTVRPLSVPCIACVRLASLPLQRFHV